MPDIVLAAHPACHGRLEYLLKGAARIPVFHEEVFEGDRDGEIRTMVDQHFVLDVITDAVSDPPDGPC